MDKKLKRNYIFIALIFLLSVIFIRPSFAEETLRVGVFTIPPFAYQENGIYKGLAIDLWEKIATQNGWKYNYVVADKKALPLLQMLNQKKLDVVIGSISVTHARLALVGFSRSYFVNPMVLLVHEQSGDFFHQLWEIFESIVVYKYYVLIGAIVLFVMTNLLWWFEYGKKSKRGRIRWRDLIWNTSLTFLTNQLVGDYKNGFARVVAILLLLVAFLFWGLTIAVFSSALTVSMSSSVKSLSDIGHRPIAVGKNTFQETLAREMGLQYLSYDTFSSEVTALLEGKVEGVMVDMAAAHYYLKLHNSSRLTVTPFVLGYNEVAFGFQLNSPYIRAFNLSLTDLQDKRTMNQLCKIYVGDDEAALCGL